MVGINLYIVSFQSVSEDIFSVHFVVRFGPVFVYPVLSSKITLLAKYSIQPRTQGLLCLREPAEV